MMAAILLPMTAEKQEWLRLGGDDVGKVFVDATGIDLTDPDHPGASTRDARKFFQFVCEENRKRGINLKYEWKRVNGRTGELKNWDLASIMKTVVHRNGHYVLIGLSKRLDEEHPRTLKRIRAVDGEEAKALQYLKTANGKQPIDHAVGVRIADSSNLLFDTACRKDSVKFDILHLADKMCDVSHCFYVDLYKIEE
jgi:hypothetical protein